MSLDLTGYKLDATGYQDILGLELRGETRDENLYALYLLTYFCMFRAPLTDDGGKKGESETRRPGEIA